MDSALTDALGLALPEFATPVGLDTAAMGDLTKPEWEDLVSRLGQVNKATGWLIGDALNFGEARKYGDCKRASELTGLSHNTVRRYASVAAKFELWSRLHTLPFVHHQEVAPLDAPERERLLRLAVENDWSKLELRNAVKGDAPVDVIAEESGPMDDELPALEKLRNAKRMLKEAYAIIREASKLAGGAYLRPDILPRHFNAIRDHINESFPAGDCPKCGGKGCITCRSKGYVSRGVLQGIMENTKCTR